MTQGPESAAAGGMSSESVEALQNVVERVSSWQETAPEGTVEDELDRGIAEAGIDVPAAVRQRLADRIAAGGPVDVGKELAENG
jgi:hypothetical protein